MSVVARTAPQLDADMLPDELWASIIALAFDHGPNDALVPLDADWRLSVETIELERSRRIGLRGLALSCHRFSELAQPEMARRVFIDSSRSLSAFRRTMSSSADAARSVRTLILTGVQLLRDQIDLERFVDGMVQDNRPRLSPLPPYNATRAHALQERIDIGNFNELLSLLTGLSNLTLGCVYGPGVNIFNDESFAPLFVVPSLRTLVGPGFSACDLTGSDKPLIEQLTHLCVMPTEHMTRAIPAHLLGRWPNLRYIRMDDDDLITIHDLLACAVSLSELDYRLHPSFGHSEVGPLADALDAWNDVHGADSTLKALRVRDISLDTSLSAIFATLPRSVRHLCVHSKVSLYGYDLALLVEPLRRSKLAKFDLIGWHDSPPTGLDEVARTCRENQIEFRVRAK